MHAATGPSAVMPPPPMPARAGVGLKAAHYATVLKERPDIGFFEVHAENYMGAGGPPHAWLSAIRAHYPLSVHGVGLSIGSEGPLDEAHLARLARVVARYEPELVSEHLAWSSHGGRYLNDLLPVPYTRATLARVATHVDQVQEQLGRPILIENPSTYVRFDDDEIPETAFLTELARRTGCGLLLDVNNVLVSATNHDFDPWEYLARFPMAAVGEIHLAGHALDHDDHGAPLAIDTHDRPVPEAVWALYRYALSRLGPTPTLVEWDGDIPAWPVLAEQARHAEAALGAHRAEARA
ncbi:MNIO family bufferin maturase [Arhodomonas sp. SL1]|uniref:MNIO family bufferin maturase n=1 Tax=Arhodomonas sp. SL1 TaxID=3425691 RepID=UPI003F88427A